MNQVSRLNGLLGALVLASLTFACGASGNNADGDNGNPNGCENRCTSFGWEACRGDGTFADPVACGDDLACAADLGCVTCVPGANYCGGENDLDILKCKDDGSGGEQVGTCTDGDVCSNGVCKDACAKAEDEPSNVGCHFWAVDLDNEASGGVLTNDAAAAQYAVAIANNNYIPVKADVYKNTGRVGEALSEELVQSVMIPAQSIAQINLPQRELDGSMGQNGSYTRNSGSGTFVSSHAYRIETAEPVVAYQFNPIVQQFSNDASILIPTQALGRDYYVLGYPTANPCFVEGFQAPGGLIDTESLPDHTSMTIIGTEDNTQVTVMPTHPIKASGGDSGIAIPLTEPGTPITFTINRYDVVNLESDQPSGSFQECLSLGPSHTGDMTGSSISSSKPVAVFSSLERGVGTGGTEIETAPGWDPDKHCCTDHLEQQMFPTAALGWQFAISRSPVRSTNPNWKEPDVYRVMATVNGTMVETNLGGSLSSFALNAGEWKAFGANHGFTLKATGGAIMVGQFLISQDYIPDGGTGDPTFVVFPAAEQHRKEYVFLVPTTFSSNYMVLSKQENATIDIDGSPLAEFNNCTTAPIGQVNGINYEQMTCPMTEGVHTVKSNKAMGLTVYGYYNVGSYGYPGGSDVKIINPID